MADNCIAAVDMGTNSFHLIIVKIKDDGTFKIIDRERAICRLGSHKGKNLSFISDEEKELAISILIRFKKLTEIYKAPIRAIATSAIREAQNRNDFIKEVKKQTGINVEVIEGSEEAELIFRGIKKSLPVEDKKVFCVDIGGGSTEILLGVKGRTAFALSIKIGAVRLSKKFFPEYIISKDSIDQCEAYIENEILLHKNIYAGKDFDFAIGTSGTIMAIASLIHSMNHSVSFKKLKDFSFNAAQLRLVYESIINSKTKEDRLKIKGMERKRADIIPAGVMILKKVFDLLDIKEMKISDYALREGIILDSIDQMKHKSFVS